MGKVTLDGKPLPDGEIAFFSVDDSKTPAGGPIREGRFSVEVPTGTVLVRINSLDVIRPAISPDDEALSRERVPRLYNTATKLRHDVTPGENDVTFDLKSK